MQNPFALHESGEREIAVKKGRSTIWALFVCLFAFGTGGGNVFRADKQIIHPYFLIYLGLWYRSPAHPLSKMFFFLLKKSPTMTHFAATSFLREKEDILSSKLELTETYAI